MTSSVRGVAVSSSPSPRATTESPAASACCTSASVASVESSRSSPRSISLPATKRRIVPSASVTLLPLTSTEATIPPKRSSPSVSGVSCFIRVVPSLTRSSIFWPSTCSQASGGGLELERTFALVTLISMLGRSAASSSRTTAAVKAAFPGACGVPGAGRRASMAGCLPAARACCTRIVNSASDAGAGLLSSSSPSSCWPVNFVSLLTTIFRLPRSNESVSAVADAAIAVTRPSTRSERVSCSACFTTTRRATSVPGMSQIVTRAGPAPSNESRPGRVMVRENCGRSLGPALRWTSQPNSTSPPTIIGRIRAGFRLSIGAPPRGLARHLVRRTSRSGGNGVFPRAFIAKRSPAPRLIRAGLDLLRGPGAWDLQLECSGRRYSGGDFSGDVAMRRDGISIGAALLAIGCSHAPPRDFAPDPGLIAQIREIRIVPQESRGCPGAPIHAAYEAILADGSSVPFARSYNKKQPPRLHVQFLERKSPDAVARQDGDWVAEPNPLATKSTGFRLTATLRANPSITSTIVLPPTYDCLRRQFAFVGASGVVGLSGQSGPDVTVRLDVQSSLFYQQLYVAGIQVGGARPVYVLADSSTIGLTEWLVVESRGGDGGNGSQ